MELRAAPSFLKKENPPSIAKCGREEIDPVTSLVPVQSFNTDSPP